MAQFRYLTAAQWGMTWKRPAVPEKLNDPEAYVHHTGGSRVHDDAVIAFRWLNSFAQEEKNYSALDYDILVHRSRSTGLITIGAGRAEWMSAATLDRNEEGEAIAVMGYFHPGHSLSEKPHPDEIEGVARAIVWGVKKGWIAKNPKILGHRDNPAHPKATPCPGDFLYAHMGTIRRRVTEMLAPPPPPPPEEKKLKFIRIKGYQDQFLILAMSHDTKVRNGGLGVTPLDLQTTLTKAQLEAFLGNGYKLTPE